MELKFETGETLENISKFEEKQTKAIAELFSGYKDETVADGITPFEYFEKRNCSLKGWKDVKVFSKNG